MSFTAIRNTAYTALMTTQFRMQVTSNNIANWDTPGYARKMVTQQNLILGGTGSGVQVTEVTSAVNKYLVRDIVHALSAKGQADRMGNYLNLMQELFGSVSGGDNGAGNSLSQTMVELEQALGALTDTPETQTTKEEAVRRLEAVAVQLRETSSGIQNLRRNIDNDIGVSVKSINGALETIDELNGQIARAQSSGQPIGDLEDVRNAALQTISEQMDIAYFVNDRNQMVINTKGGTPLLDSQVHKVKYDPRPTVTSSTVFANITVDGRSIDSEIYSGQIGAFLEMRDSIMPQAQAELDEMASTLVTALNASYNKGTTIPAPKTLSSNIEIDPADPFNGTGTVRIALLAANGDVASFADIDLDALPDPATMQDLVDAINAQLPSAPPVATLANGKLVFNAPAGQGIAMTDISSSVDGLGFSDYFGFNDLMVGTDAATINVRTDLLKTSSLFSNAVLSTDPALAVGDKGLAMSSDFMQGLVETLTGGNAFDPAGTLGAITDSFSNYASNIVLNLSITVSQANTTLRDKEMAFDNLSNAMASQVGVNVEEETAALNELQQQYSTAAQIFEVLNKMFDSLLSAAKSA